MIESIQVVFSGYLLELSASMLVGMACGVIGCFVILRGMALIGDAISHAVLPGVVLAFMLAGTGMVSLFIGAMVAGLLTTALINFVQNHSRIKGDSATGLVFTVFFAIGVILISALPRGTHFDLQCFLFGNPLAVGKADLWMMVCVASIVSLIVFLMYHPLKVASFDPVMAASIGLKPSVAHYIIMFLLAATVVAGLQSVGIIMVVAMIIAPGATAYQWTDRLGVMLILAAAFGMLSAGLGFVLSFWQNWPTGPAMTVVAGGLFLVSMVFSPRYGTLAAYLQRRKNVRHIEVEDLLKAMVRLPEYQATSDELVPLLGFSKGRVDSLIRRLDSRGLVSKLDSTLLRLTDKGLESARKMLRAHRLWEVLLTKAGIDENQIHPMAERLEHAHEMADQLDKTLGHPEVDPHGKKIPRSHNQKQ
jgi:ABC-type Mn2+/Zn2+ transport system permease subunit/Mn-dependent DtxR family transcriptional regulator